jgi:hypothetical protein
MRNERDGEWWDQNGVIWHEKNDRLWIGPFLFEMYQLGPLINKFLILPLD